MLAWLTVAGFAVRGYWSISDHPISQQRWVRVVPHVIDTLLLAAGITLAVTWRISPLAAPWLAAKLIALLLYIGLGTMTMRARSLHLRRIGLVASLISAAYIIAVAYTKNPLVLAGMT